jgi:hypothetical protein
LPACFHGFYLARGPRKGLQRKPHRICVGKSEELERKARFFAEQKMRHESSKKVNLFAPVATPFHERFIPL